jgi:hypothetical protein
VTGDLDLLISRSLDGDLPGEEERELKSLLASDPAARARYDAMAALVGRLEELPDPETPFALATRVNSQVDADTKGFAASLHRYGFYFRPATIGVVAAGIVAVALTYTVVSPSKPAATIAAKVQPAPAPDDGRVTVFFGAAGKADAKDASPASPAEAAPALPAAATAPRAAGRVAEAKGAAAEPVLVASAERADAKKEAYAPERVTASLADGAPAAPAPRAVAERAENEVAMQKSAAPESARLRAAAPAAAGRPSASVEVVGKGAGALRLAGPARLDALVGPFDGSYRLELNASGRVVDVVRLYGGSGSEPGALPERLRGLTFVPAEAAAAARSVDVRVRVP